MFLFLRAKGYGLCSDISVVCCAVLGAGSRVKCGSVSEDGGALVGFDCTVLVLRQSQESVGSGRAPDEQNPEMYDDTSFLALIQPKLFMGKMALLID